MRRTPILLAALIALIPAASAAGAPKASIIGAPTIGSTLRVAIVDATFKSVRWQVCTTRRCTDARTVGWSARYTVRMSDARRYVRAVVVATVRAKKTAKKTPKKAARTRTIRLITSVAGPVPAPPAPTPSAPTTPTAPATPVAPTVGRSFEQPFTWGTTQEVTTDSFGGVDTYRAQVTPLTVTDNATLPQATIEPGKRLVRVTLRITNLGANIHPSGGTWTALALSNTVGIGDDPSSAFAPDELPWQNIASGQTVEGAVYYQVPTATPLSSLRFYICFSRTYGPEWFWSLG